MTIIALLALIVIVAVVCLTLGMTIAKRSTHTPVVHQAHIQPHRGGGGGNVLLFFLLGIPLGIALLIGTFWVSAEVRSPQSATIVIDSTGEPIPLTSYESNLQQAPLELMTPPLAPDIPHNPSAPPVPNAAPPIIVEPQDVIGPEMQEAASETGIASANAAGSSEEQAVPSTAIRSETRFSTPEFSRVPSYALLGCGLLSLALLIGAGVWIAHRRQHWSLSGMARSTVKSFWVVPVLASVGWIGYLIWPHLSLAPLERNTAYNAAQTEFNRYADETQAQFLPGTSGLPEWVTDGITSQNQLVHVPVHGGWRESEDEARNEARAQALLIIEEDFSLAYPSSNDWRMDVTLNELHAVRDEFVESREFDFAGQKEPRYRTHLLVELSDNVRSEMASHWWPQLQEFRMGMLLTFGGLLTLICFAGGACLSVDLRTGGNYRRWLRTSTVLVVLAAAAAAHGILNSLWFTHSV